MSDDSPPDNLLPASDVAMSVCQKGHRTKAINLAYVEDGKDMQRWYFCLCCAGEWLEANFPVTIETVEK